MYSFFLTVPPSSETSRNVILSGFFARVCKNLLRIVIFHHRTHVEESGFVTDPCCLLHIMGYNNNGIFLLQFVNQFFHLSGRNGIERRCRFIHEQDGRRHSHGTRYTQTLLLSARKIQGVVTDSLTNEPIPYASVYYEGKGVGGITDADGHYSVETRQGWNKLTFSSVGYVNKVVNIIPGVTKTMNVKLRSDDIELQEVIVKPKREKYSRKNNPAVEMMKKVIAHKRNNKLDENDYYQYNKYQKITMALNDVTPEMLDKGMYKKMPFLKDQIELCEETGKFILPVSVDETASQKIYRKHPKSEKNIIKGMNSSGVNELFATGDMLSTVLKDVFTDVNI